MKHPVVTPLGHHFEKTTIESWLKTRGKVCPISGAVLTLEMLKPDRELETEILKYHFQSMMMSSNNDADEDDDALYSF